MEAAGDEYALVDFFGELNEAGNIPTALVQWQLTGDDADIRRMLESD